MALVRTCWFLIPQLCAISLMAQDRLLPHLPEFPLDSPRLSESAGVHVKEFKFEGNSALSDEELNRVVRPYKGRRINISELEDARRALSLHYASLGYINSGAVLEDQNVTDGIVVFRIIEGILSEIEIVGTRRFRLHYLESRIRRAAGPALNLNELQEQLLLIKENPNVRQINAELKPGPERGESRLDVRINEASPYRLGLQVRNDRPPSVGAEVLEVLAGHMNLTGNNDPLNFRYGLLQRDRKESVDLSGAGNLGASYQFPFTPYDTTLQLGYTRADYAVIEEPFGDLNIESESDVYSVGIRQPVYQTVQREFSLALTGERRHSQSFLLGEPFSFSPGAVDGEATVSALRFVQEYIDRNQSRVIALRSTFSLGVDVLSSTDDGTNRDGKFWSWLGQGQYVRRLWDTPNQLVLGTTAQWASDPLLSLEQFSLGGAHSVRGYRENQLVRDSAVTASVEVRVPVWFNRTGGPILQLAPFLDFGAGWNKIQTPDPTELVSTGIGLLFDPTPKIHAELYWGHAFRDFDQADDDDAQDLGLHFRLIMMAF